MECSRLTAAILLLVLCSGCISHRKALVIHEFEPGIYSGRRTTAPAEIAELRAHGVRTILSLEDMPWNIWTERRQARKMGVTFISAPILAAPVEPSHKAVTDALKTLAEPKLRPIYVHCFLGEDRNNFIMALYRIYFEDWTPQVAWNEMLRCGFHDAWRLRGLKKYFWTHTQKPEWVRQRREQSAPVLEQTSRPRDSSRAAEKLW